MLAGPLPLVLEVHLSNVAVTAAALTSRLIVSWENCILNE